MKKISHKTKVPLTTVTEDNIKTVITNVENEISQSISNQIGKDIHIDSQRVENDLVSEVEFYFMTKDEYSKLMIAIDDFIKAHPKVKDIEYFVKIISLLKC